MSLHHTTRTGRAHLVREGHFDSQGTRCAFTLRMPKGQGSFPAVLMHHGWGGVQGNWVPPFCERFLAMGLAVMTFDYRGWGRSAGLPRHVIRIQDRLADAESALACLKQQPGIDATRLVLWGTSLGGGMVCTLAERHPELLGVIAQVPMLDGRAAAKVTPLKDKLRLGLFAVADLLRGDKPLYVPIYAQPGRFGTMTRDAAHEARLTCERLYGPGADNKVAARSILTMGPYRPMDSLPRVSVPLLMLVGLKDTVAPCDVAALRTRLRPNIQLETLDANHFEPYLAPVLDTNLSHQTRFLSQLLAA